jgi:hypothetical protein
VGNRVRAVGPLILDPAIYNIIMIAVPSNGGLRVIYVERVVAIVITDLVLFAVTVMRTTAMVARTVLDRSKVLRVAYVLVVVVMCVLVGGAVTSSTVEVSTAGGTVCHCSEQRLKMKTKRGLERGRRYNEVSWMPRFDNRLGGSR